MTLHVQTNYARAVVAWCASAPEPPPLTLLQVPYLFLSMTFALLRPCCRKRAPNGKTTLPEQVGSVHGGTFSGLGLQPAVTLLLNGKNEQGRDYEGTTVPGMVGKRNSWELWKEKMSEDGLTHEVANFAAKREDTLAQEERWRNKMMRRLGDKFDHIDARIDGLSERFEHLASEIQENLRGMRVASA